MYGDQSGEFVCGMGLNGLFGMGLNGLFSGNEHVPLNRVLFGGS